MVCSLIVALANAYSVGVNLDSKVRTMGKFHYARKEIENDYIRLWKYTYTQTAVSELDSIKHRELEIYELASTGAPNDVKRLSLWQDLVFKLHRLETA